MSVWRQKNTAYTQGTSSQLWKGSNDMGCISQDCKLELVAIRGNLTAYQYFRDFLQPVVVPNFDNHLLAATPVCLDDNPRPHRLSEATAYFQSEVMTSHPWEAMSTRI